MIWWVIAGVALVLVGFGFYRYIKFRVAPYYHPSLADWKSHPHRVEEKVFSVFLIGDSGSPALIGKDAVLQLLQQKLKEKQERCAVVFLGDNIYPRGLPPEGHRQRPMAEKRLLRQLRVLDGFKGKPFFLSGNHDWNRGMPGGWEYVKRQEAFVNDYLKKPVFLPPNGCPEPVRVELTADLDLIILNTQWWVQRGKVPLGKADGCRVETEEECFEILEQLLRDSRKAGKQVVMAAHHPLYSNSEHGGKFPIKHHVFPLSAWKKRLYIPLPGAGSLYPLYRRFYGPKEDMSHPSYRRLRKRLLKIIANHENIIYAGGHDHNLQYFRKGSNHFLVSGAGSKSTYVKRGGKALFTHRHKGFFEVECHEREVWLNAWEPVMGEAKLAFRWKLFG